MSDITFRSVLDERVKSVAVAGRDVLGNKIWTCPQCEYQRRNKTDVLRHIRRNHIHFCSFCVQFFPSPADLAGHQTNFH